MYADDFVFYFLKLYIHMFFPDSVVAVYTYVTIGSSFNDLLSGNWYFDTE